MYRRVLGLIVLWDLFESACEGMVLTLNRNEPIYAGDSIIEAITHYNLLEGIRFSGS
jgi:hypothetical protein